MHLRKSSRDRTIELEKYRKIFLYILFSISHETDVDIVQYIFSIPKYYFLDPWKIPGA